MTEAKAGNATAVPYILHIGIEEGILNFLKTSAPQAKFIPIEWNKIDSLIDTPPEHCPVMAVCGSPKDPGINLPEVAQVLRSQFQETGVYFATEMPSGLKKEDLVKNGFHDVFILNVDKQIFKEAVDDALAKAGSIKAYRPVRLFDIDTKTTLDFDINVFLALNNKYVRFCNANDKLGEERFERLTSRNINSVHVSHEDLPKFYDHAAKHLQKIGSDESIPATERQAKLSGAVRNLLGSLLSDTAKEGNLGAGKAILSNCQNIVKTYILASDRGNWYKSILSAMDDSANTYTHAGRVATYAGLFSLGLGIGKPEELAAAGLLHDIGLSTVPQNIQDKPLAQRREDEQERYEKHVEDGLEMIRSRKMILSDAIVKAIGQHHENFNGKGYPKTLPGNRITKEAQVLHLADEFDELTSVHPGQRRLSPREALEQLKTMAPEDPNKQIFDPELVKKLAGLFEAASSL